MRSSKWSWDALLIASIVFAAGICAQSQQAAQAEDKVEPEGKIVRIAPDSDEGESLPPALETEAVTEPVYWIGISGRPVESAVLRTHLQLAVDMGIVVEQVVPKSPAAKAGLRKHDILLRANGAGVHGMKVLQDHVHAHQAKPLELKIIRLGKEETLVVVPEERPAKFDDPRASQGRWDGFGGGPEGIANLLEQMQREGRLPGGIQRFGPGNFFQGQPFDLNALPGGVSVSVQRENDGPARITVKQGDKTWQIDGDDPESIEQLPEELRPFVERMLQGDAPPQNNLGFDWEAELEHFLPKGIGGFRGRLGDRPAPELSAQELELKQRMERMEQELRELKKRLSEE